MNRLPLILLALLPTLSQASSNDAWAAHEKALNRACIAASGLKDVKAVSKPAEFDDRSGYSALLLQGRYPQKHMNNRKGSELCLFDRRSQTAYVTEWTPAKP